MKFGTAHKAEVRLLTILLYFILLTVIALALQSFLTAITPNLYLNALLPYFTCESAGQGINEDCRELLSGIQRTDIFNLSLTLLFLTGFFPVVMFLFSADFELYIKKFKGALQKCRQYQKTISAYSQSIATN